MNNIASRFNSLLTYHFIALFFIFLYLKSSHNWVPINVGGSDLLKIEIPFIIFLLTVFYFPKINNKIIKYVLPVLPVLLLYSLFDLFYSYFGRSPRPSDFQNYYAIFDFSPGLATGFILYALLVPLAMSFLFYIAYKELSTKSAFVNLTVRMLAIAVLFIFLLSDFFAKYTVKTFNEIIWSQQLTIEENGRLASFVFYGNREKENLNALYKHKSGEVDIYNNLYPGRLTNEKNIHVIVLESFIDPRLLDDVVFNKSPLAAELKPYLPEATEEFSHVISPVYGGFTSQAEFELLTGIKALSKITSADFNTLDGGASSSLVNRLKGLDYVSIATIASTSGFYNSKQAYKSLGFYDVTYLEESDYKVRAGDVHIFDGDTFDYSFNKIRRHIENEGTPIISYVLGMYGHIPYARNESIRPDVVNAKHKDKRIQLISNQFYYRTKAIADYVSQLLSIDPESIIYVTSDHLPPLLGDDVKYKIDKNINISLLLDGGNPVDVTGKHYYEIPWLLWDMLSNKKHSRVINNIEMEELYFQFLHESITNV